MNKINSIAAAAVTEFAPEFNTDQGYWVGAGNFPYGKLMEGPGCELRVVLLKDYADQKWYRKEVEYIHSWTGLLEWLEGHPDRWLESRKTSKILRWRDNNY